MSQVYGRMLALLVLFASPAAMAQGARDFHAEMSAENETKFTESPAKGMAEFHLDLTTLTFSWNITFNGLTGPVTSAKLYGPAQPGATGAAMFDIAPAGAKTPLKGFKVLTEAQVQYLLYGWVYVNITTDRFPKGEIRGQLDVRAPKEVTQ